MSERSVSHGTFVIERTYDASPARVFGAFTTAAAKMRWFGINEGLELDFRVGGREVGRGGPPEDRVYTYDGVYLDIVPNERIVSSYTMDRGTTRISASLATIEFRPDGKGTRLTFTEQGAFLDGHDDAAQRQHGWTELFAALAQEVEQPARV
jgi:uncharacterized protein YndB with AHSA1/START domain